MTWPPTFVACCLLCAGRIYREIYILRHLSHPNVIRLMNVEAPHLLPPTTSHQQAHRLTADSTREQQQGEQEDGHRSKRGRTQQQVQGGGRDSSLDDLYLVFELVDTDLNKLLLSAQYLSTQHIQTFLYQILLGVHYLHSANVIHRYKHPTAYWLTDHCVFTVLSLRH